MTAQQLKNSILQMAVQGKLVPQDPNDEPASVLLERIRAEKERLIKEKKIKREKNPSVIFKGADNTPYEKIGDEVRSLADEVPFDIPDSWEWVRMKYICQLIDGEKIQNASYHNLDARYMRGKAEPQTLNSGKYVSQGTYEYFKNCLKRDDELFWYFVIRFLAATGARVSELIQIKVEHIKLGHLDLYSKGGKLRRIYIPKALQNEALSWLNDKHQESGFIFLNKYGDRITTRGISGQLKKLAVRYGIDPVVIYPHSFRHRFAKSFLERCNDIAFLADLMGHESIETTRIYLRKTSTEQRAIVDEVIDW